MAVTPVIFDTDIGTDIDDTWALLQLLNSPELDPRLVLTCTGDTTVRAQIVAKFHEACGRASIPVGIGVAQTEGELPAIHQAAWVKGYDLATYPGTVYADGIAALIDVVKASAEPVTLVAAGPLTNIGAMLDREPALAGKINFVGMHGSIDKGYGQDGPSAEYNVKADVTAFRKVLAADWASIRITPLDSCGGISLKGSRYARVADSPKPGPRALMENYRIWADAVTWTSVDIEEHTSVLFDTVAIYMAYSSDLLEYEQIALSVSDDGFTRRDPDGRGVEAAMAWKDFEAYLDHLTDRLLT